MSEENVEIVRTALDNLYAFMRGELSREALAEVVDPQLEAHWRDQQTYPTRHRIFGVPRSSLSSASNMEGRGPTSPRSRLSSSRPQGIVSWLPLAKVAEAGKRRPDRDPLL